MGSANILAGIGDVRSRVYLGRDLDALEHTLRINAEHPSTILTATPMFCVVLALLGRKDEASKILERWVIKRPGIGTIEDETVAFLDSGYLEAAVLTGHRQAAKLLLNRFTGTGVCISGIWYPTCIPRHLGGAAALLGRYEEAREHYNEAIRICTEMRFRPELALTRLQLAELLLDHYPKERTGAIAHLDFAIAELQEMKMQPSLEKAFSYKEKLKT